MTIVPISDTHGYHQNLVIPPCDVLIHSGDVGGRTTITELKNFLDWFSTQPATVKLFTAGNHDLCLDRNEAEKHRLQNNMYGWSKALDEYRDSTALIKQYKVKYLKDREYVYNGVKFYGSPYSPSFHRANWAFNADPGLELQRIWGKIPSDVNVLITHTPPYGIQDLIEDEHRHAGSFDLLNVIKKRLFNLKLHIFGHIHENYGCTIQHVSNTRNLLFSNAAVLTNSYKQLITHPLIITI